MASEQEMSLLEHIQELRARLFRSVIAVIITTAGGFLVVEYIVEWLKRPLGDVVLITIDPTEAPVTFFKVALILGFGAALPYLLYQVYGFVAPGLFPNERKTFLLGIPAVLILFVLGGLFTLQVLVPVSMPMLTSWFPTIVEPMYTLERYLSFVSTLVLWMGILFQTPLVVYVIALISGVTPQQLARGRRLVWFLAAILAAVVTPTVDPVNMLLVTFPFVFLYELGILLSRVAMRQRAQREKRMET